MQRPEAIQRITVDFGTWKVTDVILRTQWDAVLAYIEALEAERDELFERLMEREGDEGAT